MQVSSMAGVGELFDDIAAIGGFGACDLVVGQFRIEIHKPVVVFRGEDQILRPAVFGDSNPLVGVEFGGIEFLVEVIVHLHGDIARTARPSSFASPRPADLGSNQTHRAPVDEEPELQFAPLFDPFRRGVQVIFGLSKARLRNRDRQEYKNGA
jgi:hypothetical protein